MSGFGGWMEGRTAVMKSRRGMMAKAKMERKKERTTPVGECGEEEKLRVQ